MFLDILVENLHKSIYRNKEALDYLHSRYVTDEDIEAYKLGYSKVVSIPDLIKWSLNKRISSFPGTA